MVGKDGSGFDIAEYGAGQNKGDGAEEELFEMFHRVFVERGDAARGGPLFVRLVFRPSVLRRQYLGGPDLETHLANWGKFGPSAGWQKMKSDPKWANSTSRNTARFLTPKLYSEL